VHNSNIANVECKHNWLSEGPKVIIKASNDAISLRVFFVV